MEAVTAGAAAAAGTARRRSPTCCRWRPRSTATARAALQGRRGVGGRLLRGARRGGHARSRSGCGPRASSRATRSRSSPTPGPSGPTPASASSPPARALVTIYQTNSPEECQYVLDHSESRAVFVEDAEQLAKVRAGPRATAPSCEHVDRDRPGRRRPRRRRDLARGAARARRAAATTSEWEARYEAVTPDDICLYIYTSGTTGPPKGCLLSHAQLPRDHRRRGGAERARGGRLAYLFLPLAHAFAILIQFASFDLGVTLAYWSRDPKKIIPDLARGQADATSRRCRACSRRSTRWPPARAEDRSSSSRRCRSA